MRKLKNDAGRSLIQPTGTVAITFASNVLPDHASWLAVRGKSVYYASDEVLKLSEINEDSASQEKGEGKNYKNENSPHLSLEIEEISQNIQGGSRTCPRENKSSLNVQEGNRTRPRENKSSQDCCRKDKGEIICLQKSKHHDV
ncbi:unnamed protein product [Parnassius apollo]|uniref:(apollo) hypothetical protein n=1 Tax=Parnassius apollo TaxID=110799 RepID=A0A8S3W222_PARAO|nr:unnamed protein product [Parnassius apollo]